MMAMTATKRVTRLVSLLFISTSVVAAGPKGTVPRASASRYTAHAELGGMTIGATLLTTDQVSRTFASDLNRCCAVVEVALYPEKGKSLDVSLDDFILRVSGTDIARKPGSAKTLAALLQRPAHDRRDITVSPTIGIGYESGPRVYDPATGSTRGGGVYTSAGVGVGVGGSGPPPASTDRDRDTMELELSEKGLPEVTAAAPVAGHLYFSLPRTKKKTAPYLLEFTQRDDKVSLSLH